MPRRDWYSVGPTPPAESCAQVGSETYLAQVHREARVYMKMLERVFPGKPPGCSWSLKGFPHDFGTYHEVVLWYDLSIEEELAFMIEVDNNLPSEWDEEARKELELFGTA